MSNFQFFKKFRITAKFVLWFLIIALVPLAIATSISYNSSRKVLEGEVANSLLAVASNKANQIEVYLKEKEKNVTILSYMSDMIDAVQNFSKAFEGSGVNSKEYRDVDNEFRLFLTYYQKSFGYDNLFLINPNGDIIFSVKGRKDLRSLYELALYKDSELPKVFFKVKDAFFAKTEVSDFEYFPKTNKAAVFIAAPVFEGTEFIGAVVLQMSNQGICELVGDYTGLGKTGETAIATKKGDEVVFITPLRHDPKAAFIRKVSIGAKGGLDIQKAVQTEEGSGITVDYRGQKVLSVWRYLPSFRLGMVVKMDIDEVFSSAENLRNTLLRISLGLLVLVVIMAILIARSVSSPIKELTKVSGVIAGGNLSARAKVKSQDEIGELAQSFNQMTDSLIEAKASLEQKSAKLEEQKKELENVNKELDSFVYTASHDLRAPLRGIASFSTFLEDDYKDKLDEEGKDYLKEIRKGANKMSELIEDLLTLSRISRIKNPYERVNMDDLISTIIERIKFDIKKNNVDLKIQKDLPTIECDRIKIGEVILNLVNNGIKFSSKVQKIPKVEIGYSDKNEFHEFFVKDNGIGIDPKYHDQIFGIFKRLHTSSEYEGTGAGLTIVKKVIDDHSGKIWIESEVDKGTTFKFTIPKTLKKEKKIGELLVEDGLISEEALEEELKKQNSTWVDMPGYKGEI